MALSRLLALTLVALLPVACLSPEADLTVVPDAGVPPGPARAPIGTGCTHASDCETNQCHGAMPEGYCIQNDCSKCPAGSACHAFGSAETFCFKSCAQPSDCRSGYQCFDSVCLPSCGVDADCGSGSVCDSGQCRKKVAVVVTSCTVDSQCTDGLCLKPENKCTKPCSSGNGCGAGEYCSLRQFFDDKGQPTSPRQVCVLAGATGGATGATCKLNSNCKSGLCHIGKCTEICEGTSCPNSTVCVKSQLPLPNEAQQAISVCLPAKEIFAWDTAGLDPQFLTSIPVPSNAVSFSIVNTATSATDTPAVLLLQAPDKKQVYTSPQAPDDFYKVPYRYYPEQQVSTFLVPNTPTYPLQHSGPYSYRIGTYNSSGQYVGTPSTKVYYKLAPGGVVSTGTLNLNFYIANMQGHPCGSVDAASAPADLKSSVDIIRTIYAKAGITIGKVSYQNFNNATYQSLNGDDPAALAGLFQNSAGQTTRGINIFLLRSLTPQGLLGVAGGIPGPPLAGTAHSGVVVTMEARCYRVLGNVIAHEAGHFLGLFHNEEQDASQNPSHVDPLPDTSSSTNNLMYWNEQGGEELSVGQGFVMRNNSLVELP